MNAPDPRHGPEVAALRGLGLALRNRRMYPTGSAVQKRTIERAVESFRGLTTPLLRVDVHPDRLIVSDGQTEETQPLEPAIARLLHEMRVGELVLERSLSRESLVALIDLLLEEAPPSELGRRLERGEIAGITARTVDFERIFAEGGDEVSPGRALWDRLLIDFSDASGGLDGDERSAGLDSDRLTELLRWIGDGQEIGPELAGFSRVDLLSIVSEQAVLAGDGDAGVSLEALARAVQGSFDAFDPEAWLDFLREPLEIEIGHGDDGAPIDLRSVVINGLSVDQASDLIGYGIQTRGRPTPRLTGLFRELLDRHPEGEQLRAHLAEESGATARLEKLDRSENPDQWVEADYARTLEASVPDLTRHRAALRPRFTELKASAVRRSALRVGISMLEREHSPESHAVTASFVCERLAALVEGGEIRLAEEALVALRRQADDGSLPDELREQAAEQLERLAGSALREAVIEALPGVAGTDFEVACRILEHLRVDAVPHLLTLVAEGSAVSRHDVARLWRHTSDLPIGRIERRIREGDGRAARALTLLAADLGRPELLPALEAGLAHEDREARRAAAGGLGRLPDEIALDPLLEALGDPALEVRVAAVPGLRRRDPAGCTERIAGALALPNTTGRNNRRIVAALKAAEVLGERSLLPSIRELAKTPWLFRRRRRVVTATASRVAKALESERSESARREPSANSLEEAA